jgi:hypothetical protein
MGREVGTRRGRVSEFYELAPRADSVRCGRFVASPTFYHRRMVFGLAATRPALATAVAYLVFRRPGAPLRFFFGDAALLVTRGMVSSIEVVAVTPRHVTLRKERVR